MRADRIIVVDWGTTAFRAWLVAADAAILGEIPTGRGMRDLDRSEFAPYCAGLLAPWRDGATPPPVYMAGMVGAAQGWVVAPQLPLPVGLAELARQLVAADGLADAWIVPGVRWESPDGEIDVMRGEEVQIFGALAIAGRDGAELCLPGTHSKWARVRSGRLERFVTHMTGEVRQVMLEHSILGKTADRDAPFDEPAFRSGMQASGRGRGLLHAMFLTRSLALWDRSTAAVGASFLSGVLIADEIRATAGERDDDGPVLLVCGDALRQPYEIALAAHGIAYRHVSAREASLNGIREVVRIAGTIAAA
ncbi:MAG: 2-dehydro-3-deoxygalactonokinase [Ancalomicrobiaceae bacterium]|nr:2-dehydro-3-deoxygalactonokinase [Ancalomicrobiaceae bacterium]